MPYYQLILRNVDAPNRATKETVVEAASEDLAMMLVPPGWIATEASKISESEARTSLGSLRWSTRKKICGKPLIQMCRALGSMLRAKLKLDTALEFYSQGLDDKDLAGVLQTILKRVGKDGETPYQAFAGVGRFDDDFLGIIKAGDAGSALGNGFRKLADRLEKNAQFKKRIMKETSMPLAAIVILIITFVAAQYTLVKQIQDWLSSMNIEPDPLVRFTFAVGDITRAVWPFVFAGTIIFGVVLLFAPKVRETIIQLVMARSRVVRNMIMGYRQLVVLSTMDLILNCYGLNKGLRAEDSIEAAITASRGGAFQPELEDVQNAFCLEGAKLGDAFKSYTSFDPQVAHMISLGEVSGSLGEQVRYLTDMYEETTSDAMDKFVSFAMTMSLSIGALLILLVASGTMLPIALTGPKIISQ